MLKILEIQHLIIIIYEITNPVIKEAITDQPRATQPAWELRGLEQNHWDFLLKNPQTHTELQFEHGVNSRMVEKDNYKPQC